MAIETVETADDTNQSRTDVALGPLPKDVTAALPDAGALTLLRPVVVSLAALYVLIATANLLQTGSMVGGLITGLTAVGFIVLAFELRHAARKRVDAKITVTQIIATLALNAVAHVLLNPSPWQVVHPVILTLAAGCLFSGSRVLAAMLAFSMASWGVSAWFVLPQQDWITTSLVVWGAAVAAVAMHRLRRNLSAETAAFLDSQRAGEQIYKSTLNAIPSPLAVLDRDGRVVFANKEWTRSKDTHLFGFAEEGSGVNYFACLARAADEGNQHARDIRFGVRAVVLGETPEFAYQYPHRSLRFRVQATLLSEGPNPRTLVVIHDITPLARAKQSAQDMEQRYALAFRTTHDGLWDWNLETKEIHFSPRWKTMLGFAQDGRVGVNSEEWLGKIHTDDARGLLAKLSDHLDGRTSEFEGEHRMRHPDGNYRWIHTRGVAIRDSDGRAVRLIGSQADITAHKRAENLRQLDAMYDPLTGLPNRSHFRGKLKQATEDTGSRTKVLYAVLYLDLDRFQLINDSLGHTVGDHLLLGIADRLKKCLRPGDAIARLGGDEFSILLEDLSDVSEATDVANKIQAAVARPFKVGGQEVYTAVSIGIAVGSYGREIAGNLLRDADTALNRAKSMGRARFELFNHRMHADAKDLFNIETALQQAIERKQFTLHYQPIIALDSGRITSCEALIRWHHPEKGLVLPGEFIPIAEETGLINSITEWTLRAATEQVKRWHDEGLPTIRVAVNISPRMLKVAKFSDLVMDILRETNLEPRFLELELTESVLMESEPATIHPLVDLSAQGIEIALDDFGTGYSSLGCLQRIPINALKVDESFTRHVSVNPGDAAIASGLIALAHNLNLRVVVEGVETQEQLDFCVAKKCQQAQGRLISPPVEAAAFREFLAKAATSPVLETSLS